MNVRRRSWRFNTYIGRRFTHEEEKYLFRNLDKDVVELATILKRPVGAIAKKLRLLKKWGLK